MKKLISILFFCWLLTACGTKTETAEEPAIKPKTSVSVVQIQQGKVDNSLILTATTVYLKRNVVTAPIAAFITKVNVHLGDKINQGTVLYEMESKERRALGSSAAKLDKDLANFGRVQVRASASGIITTFDKQQPGEYVLEGTQLCTIAESSNMAFQLNVPYEYIQFAQSGKTCRIILPDNSVHTASITTPLAAMNPTAQTQTLLAKTKETLFLPENLQVKVLLDNDQAASRQVLPKAAVLSDEMMEEFWVMKLINDSTAVKVPVQIGNKSTTETEISSPQFKATDRIILRGNYGLPDTALVKITK
ncbi:HlyD family efflux transporter periplasmic adaptor subunit (plasmid) [Adhaeribacter swui]|uniref:HlyD family efflux transporter periplasmic adaptor subunit n=1 Tax=Adhaeribacter swui TaxID=2086471 RepID=A0A7G7G219_9BACT|nr:HlyD family efflux transporter periplasmic adaptor subunit [Adhaeribacter swui]QNF31203.1 HlyD family efflux transporter periplasmic adaptor subunit [Adhaeribacter swui]